MSDRTEGWPVVNVVGERVALGPLRRDLLPLYHRWDNDFPTQRNLGGCGPMTEEQELERYETDGRSERDAWFTVYERSTWRPIGKAGLTGINYPNRRAGLRLVIGEPECRGKGYGTEATRLVLDYAFTALGLHSVMLVVFEWNEAARRAYENAGFREFGRRRECRWMGGRFWDEVQMDCLATEFESPVLERALVGSLQL